VGCSSCHFPDRELLVAIEPRANGPALHVRHHVEQEPLAGVAVEERKEMRLLEARW
jgi:hypothetical protein